MTDNNLNLKYGYINISQSIIWNDISLSIIISLWLKAQIKLHLAITVMDLSDLMF